MSETLPEAGGMPEQRGDFMLLPPLTPTFGVPSMIQQRPAEFLVTRRPVAVSTEPVGHTIDASLTGRVPARARRRMRFAAGELEHLIPPSEEEWADEEATAAPARSPASRPRAVARPRPAQRPTLPSRSDVHRSVSSPPPAPRSTSASDMPESSSRGRAPETITGELVAPPMPPSTFPGVGDSSSVVRRRGGGLPAAPATRPSEDSAAAHESGTPESGPRDVGSTESSPQGSRPRASADPASSVPAPPPAPDAPRASDVGVTPGAPDADDELTHARTSARGQVPTDAPPLQRRRSRGRITTPIVPDDDDSDLPPAVKKMLDEIDELQAGAQAPAPAPTPTPTDSSAGIGQVPSNSEGRTAARSSATDEEAEPALVHRVDAMPVSPAAGISPAGPTSATRPPAPATPSVSPSSRVSPGSSAPDRSSAPSMPPTSDESTSSASVRESSRSVSPIPDVENTPPGSAGAPPRPVRAGNAEPAEVSPSVSRTTATPLGNTAAVPEATELAHLVESASVPSQPVPAEPTRPGLAAAHDSVSPSREAGELPEIAHRVESVSMPAQGVRPAESSTQSPMTSTASAPSTVDGLVAQPPTPASSAMTPAMSDGVSDAGSAPAAPRRSAPASAVETLAHRSLAESNGSDADGDIPGSSSPVLGPSVDVPATSLRATTVGTSASATIPSARGTQTTPAAIRPVLAGRSGIQRRARSRPAPGGSARDTVPSGLAGFTGTPTPRVAGPRRVEVPEQVKQALRGSVGEPPTHVTVHEGDHAAEITGAVNAEAFTRDGQIYLAGDAPLSSARGQELLAHELTHVMQQGGRNGSMPGEHTREGQDLEATALAVEQAMASGARETIAPKALARPSRDAEQPELHHRRDGGVRESPSSSSWSTPPVPSSRPQEVVISQPMDMTPDIQRRERDLRSSALSRGLGAVGSALEQGLVSSIEQEVLGPPAAAKDKDSRYKRLERQAADLYPYIRARLRAELVRDRERRGRIARDWS